MTIINDSSKIGNGSSNLILETAGKIYVKVADRFYELDFKNPKKESTTTITNNITNTVEAPEIDLSQYVTKKYLNSTLSDYITTNGWNDVQELKDMLSDISFDNFTDPISPATVSTMQLIVGDSSLQYDFIDGLLTGNPVRPKFGIVDDFVKCPAGYIKHYTVDGPESVRPETPIQYYARWKVEKILPEDSTETDHTTYLKMEYDNSPYYVYIRAPKYIPHSETIEEETILVEYTDDYVSAHLQDDVKGKGKATYIISESAIGLETDSDPGYYYFLVAVVTSKTKGSRSLKYMYGFTEVVPGQITAYVFKTKEGTQYLDFLDKKFRIGGENNYLDWNVTERDTLTIKGNITVTGGELELLLGTTWFSTDAVPLEPDPEEDDPENLEESEESEESEDPEPEPYTQDIPHPLGPSDLTSNWPANLWTTEKIKKAHVDNLYYVIGGAHAGEVYTYVYSDNKFYWVLDTGSNYLMDAIKGRTDSRGGLIMSNLLQLGYSSGNRDNIEDYFNKFIVTSGINGICNKKDTSNFLTYEDIAAWYGGPMVDLEKDTGFQQYFTDINGNIFTFYDHPEVTKWRWKNNTDNSIHYITHNPPVKGENIYDSEHDAWSTVSFYSGGYAATVFRMDGTGYLANGNISWDTKGDLTLKGISVEDYAKIGPLEVTDDYVSLTSNGVEIFKVDANSCLINGTLKNVSTNYSNPAAIEVIDHSGTKIIDVGSKPLNTQNIPIEISGNSNTSLIYGKGSMFFGTVTIPESAYYPMTGWYTCYTPGETCSVTSLDLNVSIAKVSASITFYVGVLDFDIRNNTYYFSATATSWTGNRYFLHRSIQSGTSSYNSSFNENSIINGDVFTTTKVKDVSIDLTSWHSYCLCLYLVPGGQVQSGIVSDSWISFALGSDTTSIAINRTNTSLDKGTYIRPNGISSAFGDHSMFQWIGSMSYNLGTYDDKRSLGGLFKVALPADTSNNEVGLEVRGNLDANGNQSSSGGEVRINLGWSSSKKITVDSNGFLKVDV